MHSMYHLAKVLDVFARGDKTQAADNSVQAQLEMWDENVLVFAVHSELTAAIQKGQHVLVEFGFHAPQVPVNTVVKILDSKTGEAAWKRQRAFFETRRKQAGGMPEMETQEGERDHGMVR